MLLECLQGFTMGINCEQCLDGYYRPQGAPLTSPCIPCGCHSEGSVGHCVKGSSATVGAALGEPIAGQCICRQGFDHLKCDRCASGFSNFPHCQPCQCHTPGISDPTCSTPCRCKVPVNSSRNFGSKFTIWVNIWSQILILVRNLARNSSFDPKFG